MEGVSLSDNFAGDFATPEQQVGRFDLLTPWESCITICRQWSWKPNDKMKSEKECLQTLVRTVGGDGNLLFNVAPMPDGKIEDRQADRLREMGAWLKDYGAAIYETRGGPIQPQAWGVTASREKKIYLHVLKPVKEIILPDLSGEIMGIRSMTDDIEIGFDSDGADVKIKLPKIKKNVIDYVLEVSLK
jgi:alpha-L-fucosidase